MAESIVEALSELFADDVTARLVTSRNAFGKPLTWGAEFGFKARVGGQHRLVTNKDGSQRVSTQRMWVKGAYNLTVDHEFTLPERFSPRSPVPIQVGHFSDENGAHHETVDFA